MSNYSIHTWTIKLPVSCIANYCYLPEDINRGKKDKIIYEASDLSMPIGDIENKFSFTTEGDFEWMFYQYGEGDAEKLRKDFGDYLNGRYSTIKSKFISFFYPEANTDICNKRRQSFTHMQACLYKERATVSPKR